MRKDTCTGWLPRLFRLLLPLSLRRSGQKREETAQSVTTPPLPFERGSGGEAIGSETADDWLSLFRFAQKQALVGVLFEGIKRLSREQAPPTALLMQWVAQAEMVRRQNIRLNQASLLIYNKVCALGYRCCILKGQGNALLYANPMSRTPGDVDVWVVADRKSLRELAAELTKENGSIGEESYNHIEMTVGGIPVELHPTPALLCNPLHNHRLQQWLNEHAAEQCENRVKLPDGMGQIAVPTATFNAVYQLQHIYHHHFFEGIGLRQFVDYLLVLQNIAFTDETRRTFVRDLKRLGLRRFAGAVMYVLHEVFDLSPDEMPVPMDQRRGRLLMDDILRGGNFGQHDTRFARSAWGHNVQRLHRDLQLLRYYPAEALSEPFFRLWHWCWRKREGR